MGTKVSKKSSFQKRYTTFVAQLELKYDLMDHVDIQITWMKYYDSPLRKSTTYWVWYKKWSSIHKQVYDGKKILPPKETNV